MKMLDGHQFIGMSWYYRLQKFANTFLCESSRQVGSTSRRPLGDADAGGWSWTDQSRTKTPSAANLKATPAEKGVREHVQAIVPHYREWLLRGVSWSFCSWERQVCVLWQFIWQLVSAAPGAPAAASARPGSPRFDSARLTKQRSLTISRPQ